MYLNIDKAGRWTCVLNLAWRTYISPMKTTPQPSFFSRHSFATAVVFGSIGPFLHFVLGR